MHCLPNGYSHAFSYAKFRNEELNPIRYILSISSLHRIVLYGLRGTTTPYRWNFSYLSDKCSKIVYPTSFWYLSIFVAIIAMTWFAIIQKNVSLIHSSRIKKYIIRFSNYSFGIYLIHILVMRYILWKVALISQLGGVIQIILTFILTIVISYLLISCVSKFKFAQYIIGYSERKK